jgi:hypothetical protein
LGVLATSPHRTQPPTRFAHDDDAVHDGAEEHSLLSTVSVALADVNKGLLSDSKTGELLPV